jgi:uncharacterized protein YcbX
MAEIGRVAQLWRYPVSSLAGETLLELSIGADGAVGDRLFGVVDRETGAPAKPDSESKWAAIPFVRSRTAASGRVQISIDGRSWLDAPGKECDLALAEHFGFRVALRPFTRVAAPDFDGDLTAPRYQRAPIHLLTTASLARLKALHPSAAADARRFRPNIVVEMPEVQGAFPETGWIGRRLAIGEVELTIHEPCRRCGFTILAQEGFPNDPEILRSLVRNNNRNIGVYCVVDRPGRLAVGEAMRLI